MILHREQRATDIHDAGRYHKNNSSRAARGLQFTLVMPEIHTVVAGECLYSIAKLYGFSSWEAIYNSSDNQALKQARPDPNVLCPGDRVVIPTQAMSAKSISCGGGLSHTFQVTVQRVLFRVKVHDEDDKPIANQKFRLEVGDACFAGTTDGDGIVEQRVDTSETAARLWVFFSADEERGEHLMWDVAIGHLDPGSAPDGVQERLNNLGYVAGEPGAQSDEGIGIALRTFQRDVGIEPTGAVDAATSSQLRDFHGRI